MTRINTNITALTAQQNLTNSNNQLQVTLTRLSTGLRINSGADDPAGMIAATTLGSNIKASQQAIANSQVASQMIATADSALSQLSSLLTTINGLVTQAANTAAMSSSQIAANQLQIDSSLSAINTIAQTTIFQGQNLLNGSLDLQVTKVDSSMSKIQNLQVNQVNFGTSTQLGVNISVAALAKQAQIGATVNDGVGSDVKATSTVTFADGSSISLQAPGAGAGANGIRVDFTESSTIGAGKASATFNSTTQTLNITVSNTGKTTASAIATAINSATDFVASASSTGAVGYVAATDTSTAASTTVTTAGAGTMTITALTPGTTMNGKTVTFVEGDATNGPTVSVSAGGNLTVTINDATHNGGQTTLASIAAAINSYTDAGGHNVYSASVTNVGGFNTAVDPTTRRALDGFGAPQVKTDSVTNVTLPGANTLALTALGASENGARVVVHQVTSGAGTAVWDPAGNGGKGQLTLNLSTVGGTGGAGNVGLYTAADITGLITAAGSPFTSDVTGITTDVDATTLTGVDQITAVGNGTAGVDGWLNNSSAANLASGAGVGGVFAGGTGVSGLAANLVLQVTGNAGGQLFSFNAGTTAQQIATALNQGTDSTGVFATTEGDQLKFNSLDYGKAAIVAVKVVSEGTGGGFGSSLTASNATGTDIVATVNNISATGQANTVTLNTPSLAFSASLDPTQVSVGDVIKFNVTGGGALFQLGPVVTSAQQANLGIQSVDTSTLGGTVGRLYQLATGNDASLKNNTAKAGKIVAASLDSVTSLRGRLGAFQTSTINTNISTLTNAVTNLTAAQSSIQDADFAAESANLSREQILVQSGTTVAGIASSTPANVLSLLQKAAQV
jgi:flagellin